MKAYDPDAATVKNEAFDNYSISRAIVRDLLDAAQKYLDQGKIGCCVDALLSAHENLWGSPNVWWARHDMILFTDSFVSTRKEAMKVGHEVHVPLPPDGAQTEDIQVGS